MSHQESTGAAANQSPTSPATTNTFPVELAIYDLSRGLARSLSAQVLGGPQYAIEIIPHTAVVVYGREYFFGNGIQSEDPLDFRRNMGLHPIQIQSLGRTHVTRAEFEAWCRRMMQPPDYRYHAQSYDLFHCNCNHFSHDAALQGLRLSQGVPEWIRQVPQRCLASPLGQTVLRPLLQNMQLSNVTGAVSLQVIPSSGSNNSHQGSANHDYNPWANAPPNPRPPESSKPATDDISIQASTNASTVAAVSNVPSQPLWSNDTNMVALCVTKLLAAADDDNDENVRDGLQTVARVLSSPNATVERLDPETSHVVARFLLNALQQSLTTSTTTTTNDKPITKTKNLTYSLLLWRLLVVRPEFWRAEMKHTEMTTTSTTTAPAAECLSWMVRQLLLHDASHDDDDDVSPLCINPTARSAAWLTLSNALASAVTTPTMTTVSNASHDHQELPSSSSSALWQTRNQFLELFLSTSSSFSALWEVALVDMALESDNRNAAVSPSVRSRPEVRQAACAFLYNFTLFQWQHQRDRARHNENHKDDSNDGSLPDWMVSLLCATLEGIQEEPHATVQLRRLLIARNLLVPSEANAAATVTAAQQLIHDLGFVDALQNVVRSISSSSAAFNSNHNTSDTETSHKVATEILQILGAK